LLVARYQDPKTHEHRVIWLRDLVPDDGVLDGHTFVDCEVNGPAVLVLQGDHTVLGHNDFGGPSLEAVLWEVAPDRPTVVGAVLALNCTFNDCRFRRIGFAGPPDFIQKMRAGSSG
jgi:hypothetical protein